MKSEILSQERNIVVIKSEFDSSEVDGAVKGTVRELSNKAGIKGFRRGHVPRKTLELYFGRDGIYAEALEKLAKQSLDTVINEYELDLIAEPKLKLGVLTEGSPLEIEFTFEVRPEVDLPDDLSALTAERVVFTVTDFDVEDAFARFLDTNAKMVTVDEDRSVEPDDIVSVEYSSWRVEEDGSLKELEKDKKNMLHLGMETLRKDIAEPIVGKKLAEEFTFDIKLEEDYPDLRMSDATIRYEMEVLEIFKRVAPEATDENINELTKGKYPTVDALKATMREQMENDAAERSESTLWNSSVKALSEASELYVPESMIESQFAAMRKEREEDIKHELKIELDDFLKMNNKSIEEYDRELRDHASEMVRNTLVLDALADREDVNFTSDDLNEEILRVARAMRVNPQELADNLSTNKEEFTSFVMRVRKRNTMKLLASKVAVTDIAPTEEEGEPVCGCGDDDCTGEHSHTSEQGGAEENA